MNNNSMERSGFRVLIKVSAISCPVQTSSFPSCRVAVLVIDLTLPAVAIVMVIATVWLAYKTRQYAMSQWKFWDRSLIHM
jgi:hypothetical protein